MSTYHIIKNILSPTLSPIYGITNVGDKVVEKAEDKKQKLNPTRQRILNEMRSNPNITQPQLMAIIGIGKTAIQSNVSFLRKMDILRELVPIKVDIGKFYR